MPLPRVTVLLPVFNQAQYLGEAIQSILKQSYGDFEFLIINDGSTDESEAVIRSYRDPRIRLVHNSENRGLPRALNDGIGLALGEYIARMDADDISARDRLRTQVRFMETHPRVDICGSWYRTIGTGSTVRKLPVSHARIKAWLLRDSMLAHSTVMMRKRSLADHGLLYDPGMAISEDYEFWVRCARSLRFHNIPKVLLDYRLHSGQKTAELRKGNLTDVDGARIKALSYLKIEPDEDQRKLHLEMMSWSTPADGSFFGRSSRWFTKLLRANSREMFYQPFFLRKILYGRLKEALGLYGNALLRQNHDWAAFRKEIGRPLREARSIVPTMLALLFFQIYAAKYAASKIRKSLCPRGA